MKSVAEKIRSRTREKRAVILAHHYQVDEVKDVADYVGDSYGLAMIASRTTAEVIVLCGVRFMAESVAILAPGRTVLLPVAEAGCPLADTITPEDMKRLRKEYPGVPIVAYVNTSAEVKSYTDYCCTSANAVAVIKAIPAPKVIFVPDRNLADYVAGKSGKEVIPWSGVCHVHDRVRAADVAAARRTAPEALFVAHPECRPEVLALADAVASTSGIFKFVAASEAIDFIIGTEEGVLGRLARENPGKRFMTPRKGMVCPNMKLTTLEDVLESLEKLAPAVVVDAAVAARARVALERMVVLGGGG